MRVRRHRVAGPGSRRGVLTRLVIVAALVGLGFAYWRVPLRWLYPIYYRETIERWAKARGLDPWLVAAVVRVESNYSTVAVSSKGAMGLMQLLPETAAWVAEQVQLGGFFPDLLHDPETNVMLGTWYLGQLMESFGGRETLALAAYNAGKGRVQRWLQEAAWSGGDHDLEAIPYPETRAFVRKVLQMRHLYRWLYGDEKEAKP